MGNAWFWFVSERQWLLRCLPLFLGLEISVVFQEVLLLPLLQLLPMFPMPEDHRISHWWGSIGNDRTLLIMPLPLPLPLP
eukprot:CAMPEP_0172358874 /NCGR_PEP_ID=MMETSP1060-20121228/3160_1 /TAXON_ID=37318 /ORGANISM="Pseudo-nitzschia pungens, Strain cf. cingulata" /LENGTH=79 /DNA_ID=CAMNT_0013080293 /DNA_START=41 /DNA_END=276 /DNA_ORIENTATION=-